MSLRLSLPTPGSMRCPIFGRGARIVDVVPLEDTGRSGDGSATERRVRRRRRCSSAGLAVRARRRRPHPAITMAHGFAGVKEHGLERFARAFADGRIRGAGARPPRLRRQRRLAALRHRPVGADRRLAAGDLLPGEPTLRRPRPDRAVGQQLCRRPRDRAGSHRPAAARGGRPGAHHQRVSAEPATRGPRPGAALGGGVRRRRAQPVPRRRRRPPRPW